MQTSQHRNKPKIFRCASSGQRLRAAFVFLAIAGLFGGLALAGHYRVTLWPFPCGFKQKYNLPCPACGMTTSAVAFAQGKILRALYIQPAAGLLCCLLAVSTFLAFLIAVFGVYFGFLDRLFGEIKVRYIILAFIVIIAAGWVVTLARALAVNSQG
jgi:hypothetical protein